MPSQVQQQEELLAPHGAEEDDGIEDVEDGDGIEDGWAALNECEDWVVTP